MDKIRLEHSDISTFHILLHVEIVIEHSIRGFKVQ